MFWQIDGLAEVLEFFGQVLDLIFIAGAVHGLEISIGRLVFAALSQFFITCLKQLCHGVTTQLAAWIF